MTSALKCDIHFNCEILPSISVSFLNLATDSVYIYFVCMTVVLRRSSNHYSP